MADPPPGRDIRDVQATEWRTVGVFECIEPHISPCYGHSYGYSGGRSAHVQWCYNRFRSYNAATDSYLGYDGRYHRCNNPY